MLLAGQAAANEFITQSDQLDVDASPGSGGFVMGLEGDLWLLPPRGGEATRLIYGNDRLFRPRWSPDGTRLSYHSGSSEGTALWTFELSSGETRRLGDHHRQDAAWHPDGDRIAFAADRHGTGLDIWETDVATSLAWRITRDPGDEYAPAWSANGQHLVYVRKVDERYELVLRRRNEPEQILIESVDRLAAPSWRPDGSLIAFQRHEEGGISLEMVILSDPVLVRVIDHYANMPAVPVSWRDRMNMVYAADGLIRTRGFEDRISRPLHFRAFVSSTVVEPAPVREIVRRDVALSDVPDGRLIIRGRRLFDGIWKGYRTDMDVVIEGGRVAAVEARRDRDDGTVIDLGDVVVMPGLVEANGVVGDAVASGLALLAYGVTTIATESVPEGFEPQAWERESTPGPRLIQVEPGSVSGDVKSHADSTTPGVAALTASRQAVALGHTLPPPRRFPETPVIEFDGRPLVAGGQANGLASGASLHAELLALAAGGLDSEQALYAVSRHPARLLGLENQAGTILPGALADLLLVRGDPLTDVADTLNIVAVVRNGRFFSLVSLLERAATRQDVE
jgi:hypothetical protein